MKFELISCRACLKKKKKRQSNKLRQWSMVGYHSVGWQDEPVSRLRRYHEKKNCVVEAGRDDGWMIRGSGKNKLSQHPLYIILCERKERTCVFFYQRRPQMCCFANCTSEKTNKKKVLIISAITKWYCTDPWCSETSARLASSREPC